MRFRHVLGVLAMLCTQAVPSATTPAQEPSAATTTVFDGKYVGTATPTGGRTPLVLPNKINRHDHCWRPSDFP
jgi:hypothetical protein